MRFLSCIPLTLASTLFIQSLNAYAVQNSDEDDLALAYGDKSTISIATGNQQPLRRAPAVATVITAEDIAAMGASDLDTVLESVPGMHVARSQIAYAPIYVVRGIFSSSNPQILMLQNGIPMTAMFLGSKGGVWGGYPLEHIARIEIIRGPGSALYGADAYSGVINIITKAPADTEGTQVGGRVGSFNTWDIWAQHGGRLGPVAVAAYLRVGNTDGSNEIVVADAQSRNDKLFGTHASLAPGQIQTGREAIDANLDLSYAKWRWRAGYKLRDNVEAGAGLASALDPIGKARSQRITTDLSWTDAQFAKDWGLNFTGSTFQYADTVTTDFVLFPAGLKFPTGAFPNGMIGAPSKWERQLRLSGFATYTGFADQRVRFGLGHDDLNLYKTQELKNFTFAPNGLPIPIGAITDFSDTAPFMRPQRRKISYVYAQDEWNFARDWTLTAGLRHDHYSDFGNTTNPRVAVVWDAALNLTAKLLYGKAFRAPSFNEEYGINNPVNRGNPNLQPETIKTLEGVLSWQASTDAQINLNVFEYAMKNIIRTVPNATAGTGATYNNTGDQNGKGMELELVWDVSHNLRISSNYSHQRSIDEATHQDAGYAPHQHLYARADWRFASNWLVSPQVNWVADRERAAGDTRPEIPDYTTIDLTLRREKLAGNWDVRATVLNLLNRDAREPSLAPGTIPFDLPLPGRTFYVQLEYRL